MKQTKVWSKTNEKNSLSFCDDKDSWTNSYPKFLAAKPELNVAEYNEGFPLPENVSSGSLQDPGCLNCSDQWSESDQYYPSGNIELTSMNNMQNSCNEVQVFHVSDAAVAQTEHLPATETPLNNLELPVTADYIPMTNQCSNSNQVSLDKSPKFKPALNQIPGTTRTLHEFSGYNLYPAAAAAGVGNVHAFPAIIGSEGNYAPSSRENSAIKFRIRTITQCEVECPGNLPLANQASSFLQSGNAQTPTTGRYFTQMKNDQAATNKSNCTSMWNNQKAPGLLGSNEICAPEKQMQIRQCDQILPFQQSVSNPRQNGIGK